ncbi:Rv3235 family protein [Rhodococcus sp. 27YEA15]|uniref:Rv3235 family protein n=1 Tax=Rhodococcus sp. 27YEA15 TaxID=3156259 RepID=UPI003C7B8BF3
MREPINIRGDAMISQHAPTQHAPTGVPQFLEPAPRCEPQAHSVAVHRPRTSRTTLRSPRTSPHNGTSGRTAVTAAAPTADGADQFWTRSLRLMLEALDRRRPPRQLAGVLAPTVLDLITRLAVAENPGRRLGGARLYRSHTQASSHDAAEVCATYRRGDRTFAIAGKVERNAAGNWAITALHLA